MEDRSVFALHFASEGRGFARQHERAYAPIVHVQALAAVGRMVILTAQVLLIRVRRVDVHRKLGLAAAVTDFAAVCWAFRALSS
jgi:hypothetical protein